MHVLGKVLGNMAGIEVLYEQTSGSRIEICRLCLYKISISETISAKCTFSLHYFSFGRNQAGSARFNFYSRFTGLFI